MYKNILAFEETPLKSNYDIQTIPSIKAVSDLQDRQKVFTVLDKIISYAITNDLDFSETGRGMRFVLEIKPHQSAKLYLTHKPVAAQNYQDWLTIGKPWAPNLKPSADDIPLEKKPFIERCALAVAKGLKTVPPQNTQKLIYDTPTDNVFAVQDGSPKSLGHYIVLTQKPHATMLDSAPVSEITNIELYEIFQKAAYLFTTYANKKMTFRMTSNLGVGFQNGPRLHAHIQWDKQFVTLAPENIGLFIDPKNNIIERNHTYPPLQNYFIETLAAYTQEKDTTEKAHLEKQLFEISKKIERLKP